MTEYNNKEAVLSLGNIDPELVDTFKNAPLPVGSVNSGLELKRQRMSELEESVYENFPTLGSLESVLHIPMRDGHQSEIRVFKPANTSASGSPLVALLFGGGFIAGSNLQLVPFARALVPLYGATVVTLSYRLAPEHKFPTAAHDACDSVQWLAEHATELGANLSEGFVLGGISAGANLAIVTAHKVLKKNLKLAAPLTGLWPCIPVALSEEVIPAEYKDLWLSREQNAEAPLLSAKDIQLVEELYQHDPTSEEFTPFSPQATSFAGLPPTYVQVAGLDPLRDDGLIYEKALRNHGVETELDVYPGVPHGHFAAFPHLKSSIKSKRDTLVGIGWLLGRKGDSETFERLETLSKPRAKP